MSTDIALWGMMRMRYNEHRLVIENEEQQAEIERLQSIVASYAMTERELKQEIERLGAENKALIETLRQPDQIGYWQRRSELAEEKLTRLRAENVILRSALEAIVHNGREQGAAIQARRLLSVKRAAARGP